MEKNHFVHHKSHMDFPEVMVDPKEENDPLLIKHPLVKAENEVSCVHVCAPAYYCALLITVFKPLCSRITSVVTVHSVQQVVLFGASLWIKEVVLWTVIYKKVKQSLYRPRQAQRVPEG
jgi:hypothetical protein